MARTSRRPTMNGMHLKQMKHPLLHSLLHSLSHTHSFTHSLLLKGSELCSLWHLKARDPPATTTATATALAAGCCLWGSQKRVHVERWLACDRAQERCKGEDAVSQAHRCCCPGKQACEDATIPFVFVSGAMVCAALRSRAGSLTSWLERSRFAARR